MLRVTENAVQKSSNYKICTAVSEKVLPSGFPVSKTMRLPIEQTDIIPEAGSWLWNISVRREKPGCFAFR